MIKGSHRNHLAITLRGQFAPPKRLVLLLPKPKSDSFWRVVDLHWNNCFLILA